MWAEGDYTFDDTGVALGVVVGTETIAAFEARLAERPCSQSRHKASSTNHCLGLRSSEILMAIYRLVGQVKVDLNHPFSLERAEFLVLGTALPRITLPT